MIVFFNQGVYFEEMSTISCSSAAACRFFILSSSSLFLLWSGRWTENMNNASGFQSREKWFGCECFVHAQKMASCAPRRSLR
jgi:hypothetical protein